MRVIAGTARRCALTKPKGQAIRPTTDMVKEALFSIIQFDIAGRRVLDLFAGTGQLGIETLSRGAASCDFVDESRTAVELVQTNLARVKLEGGHVHRSRAEVFLRAGLRYDLIFLDPPYGYPKLDEIINKIAEFDILSKNGILVCETDVDQVLPPVQQPYAQGRNYRYGKVKVTLYTRDERGSRL